jgi:hypothetical protein
MSVELFGRCVREGDAAALTRLPGIGKKTAERLIIEMRDRIGELGRNPAASPRSAERRTVRRPRTRWTTPSAPWWRWATSCPRPRAWCRAIESEGMSQRSDHPAGAASQRAPLSRHPAP